MTQGSKDRKRSRIIRYIRLFKFPFTIHFTLTEFTIFRDPLSNSSIHSVSFQGGSLSAVYAKI